MSKLPAFQFYPADWRKDPAVQCLSYHDRGIWLEMICLMHESERRGVLLLNGRAMTDEMLARILGLDNQTLNQTLTTLLTYGVASREPETDALMNRRMVRDEELRKTRTEAGKKGGNPRLVNQKSNQTPTTRDNQKSTPSSSSSSSSSEEKDVPPADAGGPSAPNPIELIYDAYPRKEARGAALQAIQKAVARVQKGEGVVPPMKDRREACIYLFRRVQLYADSPAGLRGDKTLIPHPSTWFNQSRYLDDDSNWQHTGEDRGSTQQRFLTKGDINQRAFDAVFGTPESGGQDAAGARRLAASHPVTLDGQDLSAGS